MSKRNKIYTFDRSPSFWAMIRSALSSRLAPALFGSVNNLLTLGVNPKFSSIP